MPVGVGGSVVATGGDILRHLAENPRVGSGGAADHHGVAAGNAYDALGIFWRIDVAVADDGDAYGLLDGGDEVPVGTAAVALGSGARVDGDPLDSGVLGHSRYVHGDHGVFVPAGAEFDGEGNFYGRTHGTENFVEQREIAQQAGATALDYFFGGAA